ncbi:uncharacterized protein CIMG_02258 [Coccidioides immitis RS]|uniref:Uncharacterized protein n=1 Tax=Coccidioides immitis (strain RS) TaxID=246410 RepID=J3KKZ1_COCIM|nr:uncharacterized protein CIMG_02258 [Coccidioides immitis RS]EAS36904.3 hypothetical protein CIMG_02258 [Coccidioides immitis RS]
MHTHGFASRHVETNQGTPRKPSSLGEKRVAATCLCLALAPPENRPKKAPAAHWAMYVQSSSPLACLAPTGQDATSAKPSAGCCHGVGEKRPTGTRRRPGKRSTFFIQEDNGPRRMEEHFCFRSIHLSAGVTDDALKDSGC